MNGTELLAALEAAAPYVGATAIVVTFWMIRFRAARRHQRRIAALRARGVG